MYPQDWFLLKSLKGEFISSTFSASSCLLYSLACAPFLSIFKEHHSHLCFHCHIAFSFCSRISLYHLLWLHLGLIQIFHDNFDTSRCLIDIQATTCWCDCKMLQHLWKTIKFLKLNIYLPCITTIPLLDIYSRMKLYVHKKRLIKECA